MAVKLTTLKRLGGLDYVAGRLGMTPNGLRRYTKKGAEVPPARQRQLMALATELDVRLAWVEFHSLVKTPKLLKGKVHDRTDSARNSPAGGDHGGGGPLAFVY